MSEAIAPEHRCRTILSDQNGLQLRVNNARKYSSICSPATRLVDGVAGADELARRSNDEGQYVCAERTMKQVSLAANQPFSRAPKPGPAHTCYAKPEVVGKGALDQISARSLKDFTWPPGAR